MDTISQQTIEDLARHNGISPQAVTALLEALKAGHGTMAQFNHPDLGGPGQWSQGGMTMIGDMFNDALKAKVNGLCSDLSRLLREEAPEKRVKEAAGPTESSPVKERSSSNWWGGDFGHVTAGGSQNNMRYAYFSSSHRLAIKTEAGLIVYDTGDHEIGGVSQQQSADASLSFRSQHGIVPVATLRVIQKNG